MKKEKLVFRLEKLAAALVGLAIVCWIGYSVYDRVAENQENVVEETVMDTSALDEYLSSLSSGGLQKLNKKKNSPDLKT